MSGKSKGCLNERLLESDVIIIIRIFHHVDLVQSRHGNQNGSQRTRNFLCFPIMPLYLGQRTALMLNPKVNCVNAMTY